MELPFSSLVFVVLGFAISLCALLVETQSPPASLSPPPPESLSPPPPESLTPLPPESTNTTPPRESLNSPPPPLPPPPASLSPPPPESGKKIGLLFVGVTAILQIGVIGFLVVKRRQLLKV